MILKQDLKSRFKKLAAKVPVQASFLNLDFKTSISSITLGVLLAGIIMSLGSKIVATLGWAGVFAIIAIILVIILIPIILKKKNK